MWQNHYFKWNDQLCHTASIVSYPGMHRGNHIFRTVLVCLVYACIPSQGTPSPLAPSQAASAISCMVSRFLTSPGRHHSGVSLLVRHFAQKAIAAAMLKCKPLFLFILGPIVLRLIRNPIWQDSGGLASSFSCQSAERLSDSNYWSVAFSASKYKKVGKSLGRFENNFWNFDFLENG